MEKIFKKIMFYIKKYGTKKTAAGIVLSIIIFIVLIGMLSLVSCNVTRTIATTSSSYNRGDTSIVITTKTVESYNAIKH